MRTQYEYNSCGEGRIRVCRWTPKGEIRAVLQIIHGIAEHVMRYEQFAEYLNTLGILVVAEDHMGHGASKESGTQGYFAGGWDAAVDDSYNLLCSTMSEFPEIPYILFGHSMGSFMARTILMKYPDSGISAAIICGTGWMPKAVIRSGMAVSALVCRLQGERVPSKLLQGIAFGTYNRRVEHPRTEFDWLSRDERIVDAYIADPDCGFIASCGLLRDMMGGIWRIQQTKQLQNMNRDLPVLLIAGGDDPVGDYGKGVTHTAEVFRQIGMQDVSLKIFPMFRHEILNEIGKEAVYSCISNWIGEIVWLTD